MAFAGAGRKKGGNKKKTGRLLAEEWNALSDADKAKLRKECWGLFTAGYMYTHVTGCLLVGPPNSTSR